MCLCGVNGSMLLLGELGMYGILGWCVVVWLVSWLVVSLRKCCFGLSLDIVVCCVILLLLYSMVSDGDVL